MTTTPLPPESQILTRDQLKELMRETVQDTLTSLGFDVEDPLSVQRDMQAFREFRVWWEELKRKSVLTVVGTIVAGLLGLVVLGFRAWVVSGKS